MRYKISDRFTDFHAGHYLQKVMEEEGHDVQWLAMQTGKDVAFLEALFELRSMDSELFIRTGLPLGKPFLDGIHAFIFDSKEP